MESLSLLNASYDRRNQALKEMVQALRPANQSLETSSIVRNFSNYNINNSSLPQYFQEQSNYEESTSQYQCNSCLIDCSWRRYYNQRSVDFDLCIECFKKGKFELGCISSDFILIESAEILEDMFLNVLFLESKSIIDACKVFDESSMRHIDVGSLNSGLNGRSTALEYMYLDELFAENMDATFQSEALEDHFLDEFSLNSKNEGDTTETGYSSVIKGSVTLIPIVNIMPDSLNRCFLLHSLYKMYTPMVAKDHDKVVGRFIRRKGEFTVVLVGSEMIVCVWDPGIRLNSIKFKGQTINIRTLLSDSNNKFHLVGFYDPVIRVLDSKLQQRVYPYAGVHPYAVSIDLVWTNSISSTCTHVNSNGGGQPLHLTELEIKGDIPQYVPILQFELHNENEREAKILFLAHKWLIERHKFQKAFQRRGSFSIRNLPAARAKVFLEGSIIELVYKKQHLIKGITDM